LPRLPLAKASADAVVSSLMRGAAATLRLLGDLAAKDVEPERMARAALLLLLAGVRPAEAALKDITRVCLESQQGDGGWGSVEESAWCAGWLEAVGGYDAPVEAARAWMRSQCAPARGWGQGVRDIPRLPVTGVVLMLHPGLADPPATSWLVSAWEKDAAGEPVLSYKAAAVCLVLSSRLHAQRDPAFRRALASASRHLAGDVNPDGGWGPWRGHPVGSTPLWTSMSLAALASRETAAPGAVLSGAAEWLVSRQLPDGLWPDHFLEEAAAWAVFALARYVGLRGAAE